jgi:hypothetical protein
MVCAAKPPSKDQSDTSVRLRDAAMRTEIDSLHRLLSHPFIFPRAALAATLHFGFLDVLMEINTMYRLIQVK